MADKTEKAVDLGILEEDDEFEEFPAEDWKEITDTDPKNVSIIFGSIKIIKSKKGRRLGVQLGRRGQLWRFQSSAKVKNQLFWFNSHVLQYINRAELEAKGNKLAPIVDSKPEPKE